MAFEVIKFPWSGKPCLWDEWLAKFIVEHRYYSCAMHAEAKQKEIRYKYQQR